MLRQSLMCNPDINIIAFKWEDSQELPFPQYGLRRTCKAFEDILDWSLENAVGWPDR